MVSTLVAAGSVSRKSISFALSAGCSVREAIDQYIEALFTIFGDSPLAWAGIRSSLSSFPLAAANAEIWVWKSRWNAALLVAKLDASRAAEAFSTCSDAAGAAFVDTSLLAYSK